MRTIGASGLDTWVIGSVANGTPPKGQRHRKQLGEHERAGQCEATSCACGSGGCRGTEERAGERHGDDVAGRGQVPHPQHPRSEPER